MASQIISEIERLQREEQLAVFSRNEAAMAEPFSAPLPRPLTDAEKVLLGEYVKWCATKNVRYCPAKPAVVATYIVEHGGGNLLAMILAIEALHNLHGFSNPVATTLVRDTLAPLMKLDVPRSWPADEKAIFVTLPPPVSHIIAKREKDRETQLRRLQNELAAEKKRNNGSADPKATGIETGTDKMAKKQGWEKGLGPYVDHDAKLTPAKPDSDKPRDISKMVERNQNDSGNTAIK